MSTTSPLERLALFSAGVASCGLGLLAYRQWINRSSSLVRAVAKKQPAHANDELLKEQFSRNIQFFGAEKQKKFEDSFVIVVGLGGVGSHAAHLLVRSGLRRVRLIDFDQVTLSSLNRHAVAVREDVGSPKATVLANYMRKFAPHCDVDARVAMFEEDAADDLMSGNPDFVVDAIDDMKTKMDLLEYCSRNNLRLLSSMGAGAKADPTRLLIGKLSDVAFDPLASRLRWRLKKRDVNPDLVDVVYSSEKPLMKLLPLDQDQAENPDEYGAVPNFRLRVIPVLGTMPALFGMTMAAHVATQLADTPLTPLQVPEISNSAIQKLNQKLFNREKKLYEATSTNVDDDDIGFLISQWKKRCAMTGAKMGGKGFKPTFTRWHYDEPCQVDNLVLVHEKYANKLDALALEKKYPTVEDFGEEFRDAFVYIEDNLRVIKDWAKRL